MRITKYHGLGNDFIITSYHEVKDIELSTLALNVCDRHTGIGADGLIVVKENPLEMIYFNSDGSRAKMCGNGIRCFAKYVLDENISMDKSYTVNTLAGDLVLNILTQNPFMVEVNMGIPDYTPNNIPVLTKQDTFKSQIIQVLDKKLTMTSMLLGATHTVIEVDDLSGFDIIKYGKEITNLNIYPESTNANFFELLSDNHIKMQTFERGAGLTLACGTGASAVVAALQDENRVQQTVKVSLPLGDLMIKREDDSSVLMSGPAEKILDGFYGGAK
jgi:diaminopimelate epimerase